MTESLVRILKLALLRKLSRLTSTLTEELAFRIWFRMLGRHVGNIRSEVITSPHPKVCQRGVGLTSPCGRSPLLV
jgi:hypothetical protein